jgi:copper transport protein
MIAGRAASMAVRAVPAVGLAFVVLVITAQPAGAHTVLRSSTPASGAVVPRLDRLELFFTEPIEAAASHLYVEDPVGYLELPKAVPVDGDSASLAVELPPLGDGTYTVTWHVVATDGDPAEGTFTFTIDESLSSAVTTPVTLADPAADFPPDTSLAIPLDDFAVVQQIPGAGHGHGPGAMTESLARVVLDLAIATLVGGMAFVAVVWPKGARLARTRQVLVSAAALAVLASYELTAFQHAAAVGLGTAEGLVPWHLVDVLDYRFGRIAAVRLVLLVLGLRLVGRLARDGAAAARSVRWRVSASIVGLGLLDTLVLLGHAQSSGLVASTARLVHVAGISVWVGGLVMLVAVVLPRRRSVELAVVLPRFSFLATVAVGALTVGGVVLAVDLVGSVGSLTSTGYGRILLLKVAVVLGVLAVAARSRRQVQSDLIAHDVASSGPATAATEGALLVAERPTVAITAGIVTRWVGIEVGLLALVFALTALLLTRVPPA